jgi:hypothetical protein
MEAANSDGGCSGHAEKGEDILYSGEILQKWQLAYMSESSTGSDGS